MNEVLLKPLLPEIGKILRLFREKVARNQGEVARKAGISTSMLSQIERGAVSPSIDTLAAVCGSLDLSMADLFRRISPDALATQSRGVKFEQLAQSADAGYPAELLLLEIGPNKRAGFNGKGHEGVEMGYVLEGSAILLVDGTEYNLTQGDSVSYHSHMPHTIVNRGRGVFRAVWNALPPHRDYLEED